MRIKTIVVILAVLALIGAALYLTRSGGNGAASQGDDGAKRPAMLIQKKDPAAATTNDVRRRVAEMLARQTAIPNPTGKKGLVFVGRLGGDDFDGVYRDDDGKPFPKVDQEIMTRLDAAFEADDLEEIRAVADAALASRTVEVRENVVNALGWYGSKTLVEMTPFLSDNNEDVAQQAHDEWMAALQEMDEDSTKAAVIEMTLYALSDKDMLDDVAGELVGIDELAAIQVIANVMENGGSAVPYATEAYENITGEEWTGVDAAEAWLQENYANDDSFGTSEAPGSGESSPSAEEAAPPPAPNA